MADGGAQGKKVGIFFSPRLTMQQGITGGELLKYTYTLFGGNYCLNGQKTKKEKKKKITVISGFLSGRNLAKTPPLTFLGQSQPVVGSMWKNEQFFGDLNFHKSEPHQAPIV